jgi:SHS2 domain-containing protein
VRRLLAHTADLRAELAAPDLAGLCSEAVDLVREILVAESRVDTKATLTVPFLADAGSGDLDALAESFFRFLRDLVYLADTQGFLPAMVVLHGGNAHVAGERFDPARHVAERQVKAVTRHGYRFEQTPGGLRAEVVFDL